MIQADAYKDYEALRRIGQLHDVKAAITGMAANGVWQLAWNTPPRSSPISRMVRGAAAAAFLEDRALQGDWICGDALGFAHPPRRRRARQHRQQFGRTVPARDRAHQKEFPAPGSEGDGDRTAVLYTVLETAKLNGLDPMEGAVRSPESLMWTHADSWSKAAEAPGVSVSGPLILELEGGSAISVDMLVRDFGAPRGTAVCTSYESIRPYIGQMREPATRSLPLALEERDMSVLALT
ncbi:hypothetical protein QA645_19105 [Bradyrhizobium sp. CIAT3101]|uniref:hypothetical protein n=1 Tax=Bradyrhizobium sp. CIAT3101 TaxID=439387 RepID=UPI0024B23994|nr:hypothetical protein [Bradyrhizobium sp. CIAT3101]WFU84767.1 hypothetical protein QA645_19105 [Bradyrhizobium sp. CIAT3101]